MTRSPNPASKTSAAKSRPMPWPGWLELIVVSQTALPAAMFVPQLLSFRTMTRMLAFALPLIAWMATTLSGRRVAGGRIYPPAICLMFVMVWLTASLANPWINTLNSALCSLALTTAVFCPVFWAPACVVDSRQLKRLLMVLLLCSTASSLMGIAQVYQPERFRPPKIFAFEVNAEAEGGASITTDDGRQILRPPGLTDSPGGAAISGVICAAVGLAISLTDIAWWKRGIALGTALVGMTILLYCQSRSMTITLILGLLGWMGLLAMRGEKKKLALLAVFGVCLSVGAISWALRTTGSATMTRFLDLFEDKATTVFYNNRGSFIERGLTESLPRYPLGAGPGRVGMASLYFGNPLTPQDRAPLYAETQIEFWILEGGFPMLVAYTAALILAFFGVIGMAVWSPDRELAYWAGVVFVYAVAIAVGILAGPAFMSPGGVQFWVLLGALYGAKERSRVESLKARQRSGAL